VIKLAHEVYHLGGDKTYSRKKNEKKRRNKRKKKVSHPKKSKKG